MASPSELRPGDQGPDGARQRSLRVLGISGSLRRDSHNTELLRAAVTLLPSGVAATVIDRELPDAMADEIVRDREKLESSGTHSLLVGLLAELLDAARPADAVAA